MFDVLHTPKLSLVHKVLLFTLLLTGVFLLSTARAHAATLTVATGNDETTTNSSCSLSEAIENINDQAQTHPDCAAGDGNDDTISIPAGTVTLTANLPQISELTSVVIEGAGANQTIINGDNGQYVALDVLNVVDLTIRQLTITGFSARALRVVEQNVPESNVNLNNITVDGENADPTGGMTALFVQNDGLGSMTLNSSGIYVHNINESGGYTHAFIIDQTAGGSLDANITNTTVADIHSTGSAGVNGFMTSMGPYGGNGTGTLNATITNTTIDDITSEDLTAPFNSFALVTATGSSGTITTNVHNLTITGVRGNTSTFGVFSGLQSAAFFSAVGANTGSTATANVNVDNSLIADNLNGGVSHNCSAVDLTSAFSMTGTGVAAINSNGHNISDDASCTSFTNTGDQQNVNNIISTLGPLQDNGGSVPTRALLAGSPAINTGGHVLGISTDARGIARPTDCPSVGAYQYEGAVCGASTTSGSSAGGSGSLGDTGQNTKTLLAALGLTVSTGLALFLVRKRTVYRSQ